MNTYIHILHSYVNTNLHPYMHTFMCTRAYIHVQTCIHTYIHEYLHIPTCAHTNVRLYMHIYMHMYTHTYVHAYVHSHACTYMFAQVYTYKRYITYMHTLLHACWHAYRQTDKQTKSRQPLVALTTFHHVAMAALAGRAEPRLQTAAPIPRSRYMSSECQSRPVCSFGNTVTG